MLIHPNLFLINDKIKGESKKMNIFEWTKTHSNQKKKQMRYLKLGTHRENYKSFEKRIYKVLHGIIETYYVYLFFWMFFGEYKATYTWQNLENCCKALYTRQKWKSCSNSSLDNDRKVLHGSLSIWPSRRSRIIFFNFLKIGGLGPN